jgi:hypothetical protein
VLKILVVVEEALETHLQMDQLNLVVLVSF